MDRKGFQPDQQVYVLLVNSEGTRTVQEATFIHYDELGTSFSKIRVCFSQPEGFATKYMSFLVSDKNIFKTAEEAALVLAITEA